MFLGAVLDVLPEEQELRVERGHSQEPVFQGKLTDTGAYTALRDVGGRKVARLMAEVGVLVIHLY